MLCFVDMETTGLNAQVEVPLEIGITVTDDYGDLIDELNWLIWEDNTKYQIAIENAKKHSVVGPMHTESGLWENLDKGKNSTREEADNQIVEFLKATGVPEGQIPMTGNSIGSLDRPFAQFHFPKFNIYLHYRNIDMSSVKEICKRVNPELYERLRPIVEDKESATHRVLADNDACIQEYKAYLDNFLIVGD